MTGKFSNNYQRKSSKLNWIFPVHGSGLKKDIFVNTFFGLFFLFLGMYIEDYRQGRDDRNIMVGRVRNVSNVLSGNQFCLTDEWTNSRDKRFDLSVIGIESLPSVADEFTAKDFLEMSKIFDTEELNNFQNQYKRMLPETSNLMDDYTAYWEKKMPLEVFRARRLQYCTMIRNLQRAATTISG